MKSDGYISFLDENVMKSTKSLGLGRRWVFQWNDDPKHKSIAMTAWLQRNLVTLLIIAVNKFCIEPIRKSMPRTGNLNSTTCSRKPPAIEKWRHLKNGKYNSGNQNCILQYRNCPNNFGYIYIFCLLALFRLEFYIWFWKWRCISTIWCYILGENLRLFRNYNFWVIQENIET